MLPIQQLKRNIVLSSWPTEHFMICEMYHFNALHSGCVDDFQKKIEKKIGSFQILFEKFISFLNIATHGFQNAVGTFKALL